MKRQFDQEENRLDYGQLLLPDDGYELEFAVGMTYSLDLEALLSIPVSLGMLEEMDENVLKNPYVLLEAIRRSSDKIAIFCNVDGIKMPREVKSVYALLENSVFCVKRDSLSNFHPKLWIIHYRNHLGNDKIKVIVLSRNLTFDRSIDIAIELLGDVGEKEESLNQPLVDMLDFVKLDASEDKKNKIEKLKKVVKKVKGFNISDQYENYRFIPVGIGDKYKTSGFELSKGAKKLLVVSPFLTDSLLKEITENVGQTTLITRLRSVTKEIWDLYHNAGHKIYIVKEGLLDDDLLQEKLNDKNELADDVLNVSNRDLHAKIYYRSCDEGEYLSLGSLNASQNAYRHNVEFMVELKYKKGYSSYEEVVGDMLGGKYPAFEELTAFDGEPEIPEQEEHASSLKNIVKALKFAEAQLIDDGYQVTIFCDDIDQEVYIAPLFIKNSNNSNVMKLLKDSICFDKMTLKELSEFYVIKSNDDICVVKLQTNGIPLEDRDNEIYNSTIGNRTGFLAYLLFMLSDNYSDGIIGFDDFKKAIERVNDKEKKTVSPAIYEKLLTATVFEPNKIDAVEDMMKRLNEDVVDKEFKIIIEKFKKVARLNRNKAINKEGNGNINGTKGFSRSNC